MSDCLFAKFNSEDAYQLGTRMYKACQEQKLVLGLEVYLNGRTVFQFLPTGLGSDKADWIARKRNSVLYFGMSTLALFDKCKQDESVLVSKYARKLADYTLTPGSIPIRLKDGSLVGAVTVTGLAPQEDHDFVSEQLAAYYQYLEQSL